MDNLKQLKTSWVHLLNSSNRWLRTGKPLLFTDNNRAGDMWPREKILILLPLTLLLLGSLLLFTFPQITYIPCFSSEQRTEEEFLAWTRKQQQRRARVAKICESDLGLRMSHQRANLMHFSFLFNPDHNLLGCLQPKVRWRIDIWWDKWLNQGWIYDMASAFCVFSKWEKANTIGEVPTKRSGKFVGSKTY